MIRNAWNNLLELLWVLGGIVGVLAFMFAVAVSCGATCGAFSAGYDIVKGAR